MSLRSMLAATTIGTCLSLASSAMAQTGACCDIQFCFITTGGQAGCDSTPGGTTFLGLGTTVFAAMATGRNSIGYEIDANLGNIIADQVSSVVSVANVRIAERLSEHADFVRNRHETKGTFGYRNEHYGFPVVTRQEVELLLNELIAVKKSGETAFEVEYSEEAQPEHVEDWEWFFAGAKPPKRATTSTKKGRAGEPVQLDMLSLMEGE